ncbi:MAG TPA: hypothetical protein VN823_11500 [Stellaceae bacterium]|nr:hypothetical protein [Stellaceae bacterium]
MSDLESAYIPYLNGQISQPAPDDGKPHLWGQKGFHFHDLLDALNPLQHLPVISTVYRWITGDTIGNIPRIVGDAIYGGIPGFVSGLFGVLLKEETGKDVGEHVVATLFGDSNSAPTPPAQSAQQPELTTEQAAALAHAPVETAELAPLPAVAAAPATPAPAATSVTTTPAAQTAAAAPAATPATALPAASVTAAAAKPDHPAIPLARGVGMSVAAPAAAPAITVTKDTAASAFLTQATERQRQLLGSGAAPAPTGRVLSSQPVPLQLPPGAISFMSRPSATLAAAPPSPLPATGGPATSGPADISQKMLGALDKYVALQKQNTANRESRGVQVDVSP